MRARWVFGSSIFDGVEKKIQKCEEALLNCISLKLKKKKKGKYSTFPIKNNLASNSDWWLFDKINGNPALDKDWI